MAGRRQGRGPPAASMAACEPARSSRENASRWRSSSCAPSGSAVSPRPASTSAPSTRRILGTCSEGDTAVRSGRVAASIGIAPDSSSSRPRDAAATRSSSCRSRKSTSSRVNSATCCRERSVMAATTPSSSTPERPSAARTRPSRKSRTCDPAADLASSTAARPRTCARTPARTEGRGTPRAVPRAGASGRRGCSRGAGARRAGPRARGPRPGPTLACA